MDQYIKIITNDNDNDNNYKNNDDYDDNVNNNVNENDDKEFSPHIKREHVRVEKDRRVWRHK